MLETFLRVGIDHRFGRPNYLIEIAHSNPNFGTLAEINVIGFAAEHAPAGIELRNDLEIARRGNLADRTRAMKVLELGFRHRPLWFDNQRRWSGLLWRRRRRLQYRLRRWILCDGFGFRFGLRFRFGWFGFGDGRYWFDEDFVVRINPVWINNMFVLLP